MTGPSRPLAAVSALVAAAFVGGAVVAGAVLVHGPASAQDTTSTVPADPAATTTSAPAPGGDPAATTTTAPDPLGASGEALSSGAYGGQPPFDLSSMAVLGAEVRRARGALATARDRYDAAQAAIDETLGEFQRLAGRIEVVGLEREDRVADAAAAEASFRRRMVDAYVRGDQATQLIGAMGDPVDYSRGRRYLEVLAGQDRDAYDTYQARIAGLDDAEQQLVADQADLQTRVEGLEAERAVALSGLLAARRCADAYGGGSHTCPARFTFPVLGEVTFANTWGAPRLAGSVDQHWHEGTDIMAPEGREIVAVEDGTLFKVGDQGLGGLRLWLHGASGNDYYYAHFSRFAESAVDGATVTAGAVLGYVGNTGDAAGGPPHLHFEIHPSGGAPVDPYPLLKATWGRRPMPLQSVIMERVPSVVGTLPPEER